MCSPSSYNNSNNHTFVRPNEQSSHVKEESGFFFGTGPHRPKQNNTKRARFLQCDCHVFICRLDRPKMWFVDGRAHSRGHLDDESRFPRNINSFFFFYQQTDRGCPTSPSAKTGVGLSPNNQWLRSVRFCDPVFFLKLVVEFSCCFYCRCHKLQPKIHLSILCFLTLSIKHWDEFCVWIFEMNLTSSFGSGNK